MDNVCTNVSHTSIHIYKCRYSDARIEPPLRPAVPTPKPPRKRVPARVRTRARIGGTTAHYPPRRTEARPSASAVVRAAGPGGGAYIGQRGDGRGVPRADVRVESRRIVERLRAEATTRSTPTGKGSHGSRFRVLGRARSTSPPTRAHTADPSPSHTGARIHNTDRFSHIQING
jgi:hypothetical protein